MNKENIIYAGFWVRFVASFLDTLFLALPVGVVIYFISGGEWFDFAQYQANLQMAMNANINALNSQPQPSLKWELIFEISVLVVSMILWKRYKGATPGKKVVNVKIVDAKTYEEITNTQAITRSLSYIPSILLFGIGFLMVGMREDKRGLHDLIADTCVIYDEPRV